MEDWGAILRAGDIFSMDDVPIDIGPTRHGITRGTTIYFFDPSGNRNEVFAGLGYRVHKDFPTINWTVDQLAKGIFYHARDDHPASDRAVPLSRGALPLRPRVRQVAGLLRRRRRVLDTVVARRRAVIRGPADGDLTDLLPQQGRSV